MQMASPIMEPRILAKRSLFALTMGYQGMSQIIATAYTVTPLVKSQRGIHQTPSGPSVAIATETPQCPIMRAQCPQLLSSLSSQSITDPNSTNHRAINVLSQSQSMSTLPSCIICSSILSSFDPKTPE